MRSEGRRIYYKSSLRYFYDRDATTGVPVKGILKKAGVTGEGEEAEARLLCNVPEHHDLEDYIAQLQGKVKKLKSRLRDDEDLTMEDSKRVLFEDDVQRETIRRLQDELDDRRQELESLDLAIERQKDNLDKMSHKEQRLKEKRRTARRELQRVQGRTGHAHRQAFLDGGDDLDISDSDYEYDFPVYDGMTRKEHIQREVACLEETLAKRRAELRAADKLLTDCQHDLAQARAQAKATVDQYQGARGHYQTTLDEVAELEQRAHNTGVILIKAEEELATVSLEAEKLRDEREQHQSILAEIQKIITSKDAEFQNLDLKIKQSTQKLQDVQFELQTSEARYKEQLAVMKENDHSIIDKKRELDRLLKQISSDEADLEQTSSRLSVRRSELDRTEDAVRKRQAQLDGLERDLETEIDRRTKEIKDLDRQLGDLQHDRRKYNNDLQQIRQNIEHEESVLQNVAALTSERKEELHKTETALKALTAQLHGNRSEATETHHSLQQVRAKVQEEEAQMDRLHSETQRRTVELDSLNRRVTQSHDDIDALQNQRRTLEGTVSNLRKEKAALEESAREVQRHLSELRHSQGDAENSIEAAQRRLASVEAEVSRVERLLDATTREHSSTSGELDQLKTGVRDTKDELRSLDKSDEDKRKHSEARHGRLEDRLRNLGDQIKEREEEKEQLRRALDKSCQELHEAHRTSKQEKEEVMIAMRHLEAEKRGLHQELDDRSKEIIHLRQKTANEIADLESIAQTHCCRANRLSDELSYLRAEYMEVKRKLDCQEEIAERDKRLEESIRDLKSDIKYEVTDTILDHEQTKQENMVKQQESLEQSRNLANQLSDLKKSVSLIQSHDSGIHDSGDSLKESMEEHQTFLKNQLESKMARQREILQTQRQMSNDSLLNLQRKLATIEQVFSQSDSLHLSVLSDRTKTMSQTPSITKSSESISGNDISGNDSSSGVSQESTEAFKGFPKRAYSPHRYSNSRSRRSLSSPVLPEKDLS